MKLKNNSFLKKSFTLLELLVVIGIIITLVGLGTVSYSTAQKKARDARRQSDLKAAQQVMEQCYSVNSFVYPAISGTGTITATCPAPNSSITFTITDPINTGANKYSFTTSDTSYSITANLETSSTAFSVYNQQ